MKVDELVRSLLTFEMSIDDLFEEKIEGVTFKVDTEDYDNQVECDANKNMNDSIVMYSKSFIKFMRRLDKRSRNNVSTNIKDNQHQN